MRRSTPPSLSLVLLALAGCGGGSHSTQTASPFASGVSSLNGALTSTTNRSTNLKSAQTAFDQAYAKSPNDPRTAFGYGVSTAALAAASIGDLFGTDVFAFASRKGGTVHANRALLVASKRLTLLGGLGARLGAKGKTSLAASLPALAMSVRKKDDPATLLLLAADLHKVVDRLTDDRIDALETNPLVLSDPSDPSAGIKLGAVEGYALRSAVKAVLGLLDGAVAYSLDPGTYDPSAIFLTRFSAQIAAGTTLAPADYLPSGSFGTRGSNAAALLSDLGTQWTGTADDGNLALTALANRTGTDWLTDLIPLDDEDKASIKAQLDELKSAIAGPTPVPFTAPDGSTISLTVNLAAVIANPPADLKTFYPSLHAIASSAEDGTATLQPVAGSVADPTLGGLVPSGVPDAILYGRTLDIDDTTTQGAVAIWAATPFDASSLD